METRSHIWLVGGVVAVLIAALVSYVLWASPDRQDRGRRYDILFDRSVAGLQERSIVTLVGVPVGRVDRIRFDPRDPEIVRVRIRVTSREAQILEGTTASLERDLFGAATLTLEGAPPGSRPIVAAQKGRVPVIPLKRGGAFLGEGAVGVLESVSRTTDKLNAALSPAGQRSISQTIAELERRSAELADKMPVFTEKLANTRTSIRWGIGLSKELAARAEAMDEKLRSGRPQAEEMRRNLQATRAALETFDARIEAARPMLRDMAGTGLQEQAHELHVTVSQLKDKVQQVDTSGAGSILSSPELPDYEPAP